MYFEFFFWWKLLGARPTVILSIKEIRGGHNHDSAELTGAVRILAELGHRVVVDSSPNSLEPEVLTTERQVVINVEALDIDTFRKDPEFLALFNNLDHDACENCRNFCDSIPTLRSYFPN